VKISHDPFNLITHLRIRFSIWQTRCGSLPGGRIRFRIQVFCRSIHCTYSPVPIQVSIHPVMCLPNTLKYSAYGIPFFGSFWGGMIQGSIQVFQHVYSGFHSDFSACIFRFFTLAGTEGDADMTRVRIPVLTPAHGMSVVRALQPPAGTSAGRDALLAG